LVANRLNLEEESKVIWFKNGLTKEIYSTTLSFRTKSLRAIIQEAKIIENLLSQGAARL
jgi:hypothetical protein